MRIITPSIIINNEEAIWILFVYLLNLTPKVSWVKANETKANQIKVIKGK